jgi:hypothetical protein
LVNAIPIIIDGATVALFIPKASRPEGLNFYSNPEDGLQFATYTGGMGYTIKPHIHFERTEVIKEVNEVIYIESGMVQVDLYGDHDLPIVQKLLRQGDTICLLRGGHGFVFIEPSTLIYVKQGAYVSKELDKRMI